MSAAIIIGAVLVVLVLWAATWAFRENRRKKKIEEAYRAPAGRRVNGKPRDSSKVVHTARGRTKRHDDSSDVAGLVVAAHVFDDEDCCGDHCDHDHDCHAHGDDLSPDESESHGSAYAHRQSDTTRESEPSLPEPEPERFTSAPSSYEPPSLPNAPSYSDSYSDAYSDSGSFGGYDSGGGSSYDSGGGYGGGGDFDGGSW